ncbi:MAG TPA: hypothetical protein VFY51_11280, partial [Pyrinomonadaceae bacterium]|nr:hypothetical protein [Pyrinomonadaceae bacterium]
MQQVERGLGPTGTFLVGATEAGGLDREVQCFRKTWIARRSTGPLKHLLDNVVWGGVQRYQSFPFAFGGCLFGRREKEQT